MPLDSHPSSFRDPDGIVFSKNGFIYRCVFESYRNNYDLLNASGLYNTLTSEQLLISHTEADPAAFEQIPGRQIYKILQPESIHFISYPYEWCFSQLKMAALLTLDIQLKALEKGMTLKDATAYNIQFRGAAPVFIDTLSFEKYEENQPWQAYGQFCRHFYGPLLLWTYHKSEISQLSLKYPDGIPLSVISYSLPWKTKFSFSIQSHIHYHAQLEKTHGGNTSGKLKTLSLSKNRLVAIITHLKNQIQQLQLRPQSSPWLNYYETFSYSQDAFEIKKNTISSIINTLVPKHVLDIGCNDGEFSLICAGKAEQVVSIDSDASVVNNLQAKVSTLGIKNVLPLVVDITNPSPGIGFQNTERTAFLERGKFDLVLALALLHHVTISGNIPFSLFAKQLADLAPMLVIEYVPKEDPQTQRLLVSRKDIFDGYHLEGFVKAFEHFFTVRQQHKISNPERIIFLMERHA
ncbi:MAG: methyltransferase domain-containing protein [Bacteroidota bacterium]